jgi:hypothetical protein
MATILSQKVQPVGGYNVVTTLVELTANSDSVTLPRMAATSGKVAQLTRPGDTAATISQTNVTDVAITGVSGNQVLLVSLSDDPIPNPAGAGA